MDFMGKRNCKMIELIAENMIGTGVKKSIL